VFEIAKTAGGYAGTPTTLVNFNGEDGLFPEGSLIADANGDLFGTTLDGGANDDGTVFEIARTAGGYASTPTTLVSFNGTNGFLPGGSLIADANGDLFGTTTGRDPTTGDPITDGTVFEIAETGAGYASAPTTLVSFNGTNGEAPFGSLIADSNGNLVGTTDSGGANDDGTVFEITGSGFALTRTAPTLTTLVSFNDDDGAFPEGGLIADSQGNLFGATESGGANDDGVVFEITKTAAGYASTPTTLASFNGANGESPFAGLIADANGDLFGTTTDGGANDDGSVFEIVKTAGGYASTPTTLVSFNGGNGETPFAGLIADANGDLFGATDSGGANDDGTVFEIVKTPTGYASAPTTLVSFNGTNGETPIGTLISDSNGDLFGTTQEGGANHDGAVFEIVKTAGGYASTPTTLVSFNGTNGAFPDSGLIADAHGDLFGTTLESLANHDATVFEIVKTAGGYASAPTTLVTFNGTNGLSPQGSLIADAHGDLFGTATGLDPTTNDPLTDGTVFEIKKTAGGYARTPTILVSFNGTNGETPNGRLIADANGDLFGATASGGSGGGGTVFEITDSGFVPVTPLPTGSSDILWQNAKGQASIWDIDGITRIGGGAVSPNPGPSWRAVGTGDFNHDGLSDILWQNTSTGQASIWEMDGITRTGGSAVSPNPGPNWKVVGTGDFNHDGLSDILWQNRATGQASVWEMDGNTRTGGGAVSPNPGPSWKAVGTGDFNGDGDADILWQNANGQISVWEMDGNTRTGGGAVGVNPGPAWHAIGTGDFNQDGLSDILLQNAGTGQVSIWEMDGATRTGGGAVSVNPGPAWHAIGTDGGSDILFQNTSGQTSLWEMGGTTRTAAGAVSPNAGPSWRAVDLT
jgi:uncharacterized repeat protein (TIGR03803 family)